MKSQKNINFIESIIRSLMDLYNYAFINKSIFNFLFLLGSFQYILFSNQIFQTNNFENDDFKNALIDTPLNKFWYVQKLSRIDLLFQEIYVFQKLGYLIPLSISILFEIIPLFFKIISIEIKISLYKQICSIYQQLFSFYFYIPLSCICFNSLKYNINHKEINNIVISYLNIFLSIITVLWLFIMNFIKLLFCKETLDFEINCYNTLELNIIDYILYIFQILQMIIYYFIKTNNETIQAIIIIITSLFLIVNLFSYYICSQIGVNIQIFVISYSIIQSFLIIIQQFIDISDLCNILIFILFPLLYYVINFLYYYIEFTLILNGKQETIKNCRYIFAKLLNNQFQTKSQKIILYTKILYICSKRKSLQIKQPWNNLSEELLPSEIMNRYFKIQLKQYLKLLYKSDQKKQNSIYYIHYAVILFKLNYHNLGLKQINMFLIHKNIYSQNKSIPINDSNNLKSFNTHNPKSSYSKSSKSQDVQDAAALQQNKTNKLLINFNNQQLIFYTKIRAIIIRDKIREKMTNIFQFKQIGAEKNSIQSGVELYLKSEQLNQNLKDQLIQIINYKLSFFQKLIQVKHFSIIQLFRITKLLCYNIKDLEYKIDQLYKNFPSSRIQSLATYFQSEILNNYLEAYKISCNSSISDDKIINFHNNIKNILFNNSLIFVNIKYEEELQELYIENITPQMSSFFKKDFEYFNQFNQISQILPEGIKNEHPLLVQRFLQDQQSKFYLKKHLNFFKIYEVFIQPCDFFFDVDFSNIQQIHFFAFFTDCFQTSSFLLFDVNHQLGGLTLNLLEKIGFTNFNISSYQQELLQNIPIELMIPKFQQIINNNEQLTYTQLNFIKQSKLQNLQEKIKVNNLLEWSNQDNLIHCECLLQIIQNDIYGFKYYIIEIKEIKLENSALQNDFNIENCSIDNQFSIIQDQEEEIKSPQVLEIEKQKFHIFKHDSYYNIDQDVDRSKAYYNPESAKYEINLLSPADISVNPIILNSANPLLKQKQQEFFNQIGQDVAYSSQFSSKQARAIDLDDLDQTKLIAKPILKSKETNSSQFSGIKNSQFYKKYEMIHLIIQPHKSKRMKIFLFLQIIQLIFGCIHFIIVISKNHIDLNQFLSEIDMIELHSSFMAPHDIFVAMRVAIVAYNSYVTEGAINSSFAYQLTLPFYNNIEVGFNELKVIFAQQLTNINLQPFFENKTITLIFMDSNTSHLYNNTLTIREGLQQTVQNLYTYKVWYSQRRSTSGSSVQVFAVANQFHLHSWLENLTLEIMNYSKNRSELILTDWMIEYIIFVLITFFFLFLILYHYKQYYKIYDKYLGVYKYTNQNKLGYEIEKYKILQKQFQKNPDMAFQYRFDLNYKEQQILTQQKIQDTLNKQNKEQQRIIEDNYDSLSIIFGLSIIIGIWIVFIILGVIIFQGEASYLNKYSDTVDIYKLVQDMTISSATLYQNRDFHYLWGNFSYLTTTDESIIYSLISEGINNIVKFGQLTSSFDQNKYQVSNDFVSFLNDIQEKSICTILDSNILGFLTQFCNITMQGNLQNGVLATLQYMKNTIQTQQAYNNFTKRIEHPLYDNEGGIIMVRVFQLMTTKLKNSLISVTSQLQTISSVLAIIYLIFSFIIILLTIFIVYEYFIKEYNIIKRFIQLLPISITLLDDQFERYIRLLLKEEQN